MSDANAGASGPLFGWTREAKIRAADSWRQGISAGLIAAKLEASRRAVVAKLRRMGMTRANQAQPSFSFLPPPSANPRAKPKPGQPKPAQDQSPWIPFGALAPRACRFPRGEGAEMRFCGAAAEWPSRYCKAHKDICSSTREPRR